MLRGLSFGLAAGQALQVSWANGAGKTSLLRALAGLLLVEEGEILWRGRSVMQDWPAFHRELAFFGHELGLKPDLTAMENLHFVAGLRVPSSPERQKAALQRVGLAEMEDEPVRRFSAGQQRRVALARLRLQGATLWLLDEPAAHLDAQGQRLVAELIEEHLGQGGAAIIATHQPLPLAAASSGFLPEQSGEEV